MIADVKRGRQDMDRRRSHVEVYERQGHWLTTEDEAAERYMRRSADQYESRHTPKEILYSGAPGRILAVGGRSVRRGRLQ